jgi:hypothetical protein|tara:strand:+ start:813 stop:1055 length:243 start_codon:yes stop_codon:yes gene_type:complete
MITYSLRDKLIKDLKYLEKMYKEQDIPINLDWTKIYKEKKEVILQNMVERYNKKLDSFLSDKPSYNDWMEEIAKEIKNKK